MTFRIKTSSPGKICSVANEITTRHALLVKYVSHQMVSRVFPHVCWLKQYHLITIPFRRPFKETIQFSSPFKCQSVAYSNCFPLSSSQLHQLNSTTNCLPWATREAVDLRSDSSSTSSRLPSGRSFNWSAAGLVSKRGSNGPSNSLVRLFVRCEHRRRPFNQSQNRLLSEQKTETTAFSTCCNHVVCSLRFSGYLPLMQLSWLARSRNRSFWLTMSRCRCRYNNNNNNNRSE